MGDFKKVIFEPGKKTIKVRRGSRLVEVARDADLKLETDCGGLGKCGKCKILIADGAGKPTAAERFHLSSSDLERGYRLACCAIVERDMRVILPERSVTVGGKGRFKDPGSGLVPEPALRKEYLRLPSPTLEDQDSDSARLRRCLRGPKPEIFPLSVYRELPEVLREDNFHVTVIGDGRVIRGVEPGNTASTNLGVAIDIGTTT
ncbi:MAG: 2Fe-2S iron-sulfur cluster binding domain-containing protein, partial [Firmicutes bacterium]|nr:2Fe-2S iron-sulfur cluster binding domain-containing protein [Bacillota bacterium]